MFNEFPYTDLHNLNLDWFLNQFKDIIKRIADLKKMVANAPDATNASEGQTPIADGAGGWSWENVQSGSGLTEDIKSAMLQIAQKIAYIDDHGQTYYDALYDALYPIVHPAALTGITCVYTQSGPVYENDSLDSLRNDLVVTASYDNGTTQTVTGYTLSGTLAEGTSIITVSYGGYTDTFTVTVTNVTGDALYYWDLTNSLVDLVDGNTATLSGATQTSQGLSVSNDTSYARFPDVIGLNRRIEVDVTSIDRSGTQNVNHGRFIMLNKATLESPTVDTGFIWRSNGYWAIFRGPYNSWVNSNFTDPTMFNGKTVTFTIDADGNVTVESDGAIIVSTTSPVTISSDDSGLYIGSPSGNSLYNLTITGVRVYEVTP